EIVNANRSTEDAEFEDALDQLKVYDEAEDKIALPRAVTLDEIRTHATGGFLEWINDRANRRAIPHRLDAAGYVPVRNPDAPKDGYWKIGDKRQAVYARKDLSTQERTDAVKIQVNNLNRKTPSRDR